MMSFRLNINNHSAEIQSEFKPYRWEWWAWFLTRLLLWLSKTQFVTKSRDFFAFPGCTCSSFLRWCWTQCWFGCVWANPLWACSLSQIHWLRIFDSTSLSSRQQWECTWDLWMCEIFISNFGMRCDSRHLSGAVWWTDFRSNRCGQAHHGSRCSSSDSLIVSTMMHSIKDSKYLKATGLNAFYR